MTKLLIFFALISIFSSSAGAQTKKKTAPTAKTVKKQTVKKEVETKSPTQTFDKGEIIGNFYFNQTFEFTIPLPENWNFLDVKTKSKLIDQGFSANLINNQGFTDDKKLQLEKSFKNIIVGLTAVKNVKKTTENAVFQISFENLAEIPQVKDAVDYLELMVQRLKELNLPEDFVFSEVNAEELREKQFGFLDIQANNGKKRIYVTTRKKYAILFTLTYKDKADLEMLRSLLSDADFSIEGNL